MQYNVGVRKLRKRQPTPELKALVVEASQALARLDAARLEELALSCEALSRDLDQIKEDDVWRRDLAQQAREATEDMGVFARVLEATRSNLNVMHRLRELRMGQLEYKVSSNAGSWAKSEAEESNGNH